MKRLCAVMALMVSILVLGSLGGYGNSGAFADPGHDSGGASGNQPGDAHHQDHDVAPVHEHAHVPVCPTPDGPDAVRCLSHVVTDFHGDPASSPASANGPYAPADLQSAYSLTSASASNGGGKSVAIVDAYYDATAQSDLTAYRQQFALPALKSCPATPCLQQVNEQGQAITTRSHPPANTSWGIEISRDLDMVSAICPNCSIVLVEANSTSYTDLGTAENTAATRFPGVVAISNSWGGSETGSETRYDTSYFHHPGIAITAASGDWDYGVYWPAASQYVTAVGGTTLTNSNGGATWGETVWSGASSGCSAYEPEPSWQTSLGLSGCSKRMVADVAAVANPSTGVYVYDSGYERGYTWWQVGGTSVASPIVASVYALSGNAASVTYGSFPYSHTSSFNDVTSGCNTPNSGSCTLTGTGTGNCTPIFLCTGETGYDGPTGLGSPKGAGGF